MLNFVLLLNIEHGRRIVENLGVLLAKLEEGYDNP